MLMTNNGLSAECLKSRKRISCSSHVSLVQLERSVYVPVTCAHHKKMLQEGRVRVMESDIVDRSESKQSYDVREDRSRSDLSMV